MTQAKSKTHSDVHAAKKAVQAKPSVIAGKKHVAHNANSHTRTAGQMDKSC